MSEIESTQIVPGSKLPGFRTNALGHLVPEASIKEIDLLRDDTVTEIVKSGLALRQQMIDWKRKVVGDIAAFCALSAEKYGYKWGGKKGNINLVSFDGKYKVLIAVNDVIAFDERVQIAKELMCECLSEWASDARPELQGLVNYTFQTDKAGKLSTSRILSVLRYDIDHPKWKRAMEALKDSIQVTATAQYLRLCERVAGTDRYRQIPLDISVM